MFSSEITSNLENDSFFKAIAFEIVSNLYCLLLIIFSTNSSIDNSSHLNCSLSTLLVSLNISSTI